ncbi:hypothetical protein ODV15_07455 [Lactobacillus amylovorus]|uniref:Uncharacterized protein n=1 Tax=Lactobacillus amylovorus TaxID=1604 RepID=A0A9X4ADF1_LACAM|nr:hypothetical protein [Lactobacillus amylovorus]MDB6262383.1 hypothetical protein [Lactobacillus amylovorus]
MFISDKSRKGNSGGKYTLEELQSMIDYPNVTYRDIATFDQIRNSYSNDPYITQKLHYHKLKVWHRHDEEENAVTGYLKRDVEKFVKEKSKPAVVLEGVAYPKWKDAAKAYNCTIATLHKRIKKYGPNDGLGLREQIEFLGKYYSSKREIAKHYQISFRVFQQRERMGCKPEEIILPKKEFEALMAKKNQLAVPNKKTVVKKPPKKSTIIDKPITLNGVKYPGGIREAAMEHYLDPYTLLTRIKKHGVNYDRLFDKIMTKNRGPIKLQGKSYPGGFPQAAKENKIGYKLLYGRYRKYGPNDPRLFLPANEGRFKNIVILNHKYKNLAEFSKVFDIPYKVLNKRLKKYGYEDIRLIDNYNDLQFSNFEQYDRPELNRPVSIVGKEYSSIVDFCKKIGISYKTFLNRKKAVGLNDNKMFAEPSKQPVLIILNYIFFSWNQAARFYNINAGRLKNLVAAGYKDQQLVQMIKNKTKIPVSRQNRKSNPYKVKILGKEYNSIAEFARLHNIVPSALHARIRKYGTNNPKILATDLKNNVEVTINGVKYSSLQSAGKALNISTAALRHRLDAGKQGNELVDYLNRFSVTLCGHQYKSVAEAARLHGLVPQTLNVRIERYGKNDPRIFKQAKTINRKTNKNLWKITILGKEYISINECAKLHGISAGTLKSTH